MRRRRNSRLGVAGSGALVIVIAVLATYFGFTKMIPFQHHFTLKGVFTSANNIALNSPVRIAGVKVGKVTMVKPLGRGQSAAMVTMRIDDQGLPIHSDATLAIRPRIFLEGNFFVDIHPGSPSVKNIPDGGMIPINQTSDPVQLDQVLSVLKTATRTDLQNLLKELSKGFSGRGAASFNESIPLMRPAFQFNSIVNDALLGQVQHDLSNYINSSGVVAQATDADPAALQGLFRDFNRTAGALASRDQQLASAIHELPSTLSVAQPALTSLDRALPSVNQFAKALDPGVRSTLPAIRASTPLIDQLRLLVRPAELRGLVRDLRPTVPALNALNRATVPLLGQVRPASSCQNNVIIPWTHETLPDASFPATGPVYQDGVKFLPGIAGESRSGDANGQWQRVLVAPPVFATPAPNNQILMTGQPIMGTNPPIPAQRPPLRPDVPCETQPVPSLATTPGSSPVGQKPISVPSTPLTNQILQAANQVVNGLLGKLKASAPVNNTGLRYNAKPFNPSQLQALRSLAK